MRVSVARQPDNTNIWSGVDVVRGLSSGEKVGPKYPRYQRAHQEPCRLYASLGPHPYTPSFPSLTPWPSLGLNIHKSLG